ncbi:MAG: hypothetical protein WBG54_15510 [Acidobacteriaceae bacterium]
MSRFSAILPGRLVLALGLLTVASPAALCQLNSRTASVALTATLAESLTVAATPNAVTFNLVSGGKSTGSAPIAITTTWAMRRRRSAVTLTGYFSSAAAALTSGGTPAANIPTSEVFGEVSTGTPTTYTAFTQSPARNGLGVSGASLVLFTQAITTANRSSRRTDDLNLQINLTGNPQLPAGEYTGTLNLQAQEL